MNALLLFAVNTGLRFGDIFDLMWEEVDLEQRRLSIITEKKSLQIGIAAQ